MQACIFAPLFAVAHSNLLVLNLQACLRHASVAGRRSFRRLRSCQRYWRTEPAPSPEVDAVAAVPKHAIALPPKKFSGLMRSMVAACRSLA